MDDTDTLEIPTASHPTRHRRRPRSPVEKFPFNAKALAALTCEPRHRYGRAVYDSKTPNLMLMILPTGARSYYWYGRVRGEVRPVKVRIGGPELPLEFVRDRAKDISAKSAAGINCNKELKAQRERSRQNRTLGQLWEAYRAGFLDVRATLKTRITWESLWRVWLSSWANKSALSIDGDALRALHAEIAAGKVDEVTGRRLGGKRTANKAIHLLRAIFNHSRLVNPVQRGAVNYFRQHSRERYLTPPELKRFFVALEDEPDQTNVDFCLLALFTGARRGNVQSMRWDELDLDAMKWTIPAKKTKAGKPIEVPLTPPAMEVLLARRELNARREGGPSEYVLWSARGAAGHITEPRKAFARICKRAKLNDLRIHDLRRTLGSWQVAMGSSLPVIGRSLGHANQQSTAIYARLNIDPVRKSVTTAVDAMLKAAGVGAVGTLVHVVKLADVGPVLLRGFTGDKSGMIELAERPLVKGKAVDTLPGNLAAIGVDVPAEVLKGREIEAANDEPRRWRVPVAEVNQYTRRLLTIELTSPTQSGKGSRS